MQLWSKGIPLNKMVGEFTSGKDREPDLRLAPWDVMGSIAHVKMLNSIGILTNKELSDLVNELKDIYKNIEAGRFAIEGDVEDVHSQVELMLTRELGDTGKKVHTARSRNDQVLLDIKLFARNGIKEIAMKTDELFRSLISLSNRYKDTLMPGYTHMQVAMPSSFGLWFGGYAESLTEEMILLQAAYKITDQNPLGSAAGYGSSFPVDRRMTTGLLGFGNMHVNVINAQMNRGRMEKTIAFVLGSAGSVLSRLATDICTYSGQNFGFFTLPDEFTTGSSIMPHKKNPDVFELVRARGNQLQALSYEVSLIGTNLTSGYHRDYQVIKERLIPAFDTLSEMLSITGIVIDRLALKNDLVDNELYRDIFSVEEVNRIVMEGYSFREAYRMVAGKIADGSYSPDKKINHTHIGSLGNLCNDEIEKKMDGILAGFNFNRADNALRKLIE